MGKSNPRIIFLIWKFNDPTTTGWDLYEGIVYFKCYDIKGNSDKFIAIKLPDNDNEESVQLFSKIIELINERKSNYESLVLCHNKPSKIKNDATQLKYILFQGTSNEHKILYEKIITGSTFIPDAFENAELKSDIFNDIWNEYNKKKVYEKLKKNLINLWLPLAIDIQGLSEVQNDLNKANQYFEEIKKETEYLESLKSFSEDDDFPRCEEIKQTLKQNEMTENFAEINPKSIAEMLLKPDTDFDSFKNAKYLEKEIKGKPNPNFLPNWLQEVVRVIDEKLKQND